MTTFLLCASGNRVAEVPRYPRAVCIIFHLVVEALNEKGFLLQAKPEADGF
jgi:hypothetical protein